MVDIFISADNFQFQSHQDERWLCQIMGGKQEVTSLQVYTGGAASNVAVGLRRLGFPTAAIAELGQDDFAEIVTHDLKREQVDTSYLIAERKEQTGGSVILVAPNGERAVMVHRGAAALLDVTDLPGAAISQAHWLHLSSVGGREAVIRQLFTWSREHQVGLSWNPGQLELTLLQEQGAKGLGVSCQVLIVNNQEWQQVESAQAELLTMVPEIVVTNGKQGGWWYYHGQRQGEYTSPEVTSVDDTGAGDAFATGYVAARLAEREPDEAVHWGTHNAAAVVQQVGAKPGLLTWSQLEKMVPTHD